MLDKLPGWVVDNATSVREECEPYRNLSPQQHGEILRSVCQAAVNLAMSRADRDRVFNWKDKLPASTLAALERLRSTHGR